MKINYTNHALERLRQRRVSKSDVEKAIQLGIKIDAVDGARTATLTDKSTALIVIYAIKDSVTIEVITAYRK